MEHFRLVEHYQIAGWMWRSTFVCLMSASVCLHIILICQFDAFINHTNGGIK